MSPGPALSTGDHEVWEPGTEANPLAALIDRLQRNWAVGDNTANDDLMVQIREYIRRQRLRDEIYGDDLDPAPDSDPPQVDHRYPDLGE